MEVLRPSFVCFIQFMVEYSNYIQQIDSFGTHILDLKGGRIPPLTLT